MTVSIDWGTYVISVPSGDLTHIQSVPTIIKEMDIDWFRLQLKDIEDSEEGMVFPNTHNHNTEVSLGGLTYARVVEILDPYTITFEDGQYAVNLVGANSNIGDKVNVNQVSVRSNNSAGMISSPEIQYSTFQNRVTIDTVDGSAGTVYPKGTPLDPVNNLDDALFIAEYRGFKELFLLSDLTIPSGYDIGTYTVKSDNWLVVNVASGALTNDTVFDQISLYGAFNGYWNVLNNCWANDLTNFTGWLVGGSFGQIQLAPYNEASAGQSFFDNIVPLYPNEQSVLIMNSGVAVAMTSCSDLYTVKNMADGSILKIGLNEGVVTLDASCSGGEVHIAGIGEVINNSTIVPDISNLIRGKEMQLSSYNNGVTIDTINGTDDTIYPYGTIFSPCKTLDNAITIAQDHGFKRIYMNSNLVIPSSTFALYDFIGRGHDITTLTIDNSLLDRCVVRNSKVTGYCASGSYIETFVCELDDLYNISIDAYECTLEGKLGLANQDDCNFYACVDGIAGAGTPTLILNNCDSVGLWRYSGGVALSGIINPNINISVNFNSGRLSVDSSDIAGSITVRGIGSITGTTGGTTINADGLISNDSIWNNDVRTLTSAGAGGATAQEVWEYTNRSLNRAVSVSGIPTVNTVQVSGEYVRKEDLQGAGSNLTAADIWTYGNRTLTDQRLAAVSGILDLMAPLLIGTVTGAGTNEEIYTYGGKTVKVYATTEGNVTSVVFS
jgi:hypothetical protein